MALFLLNNSRKKQGRIEPVVQFRSPGSEFDALTPDQLPPLAWIYDNETLHDTVHFSIPQGLLRREYGLIAGFDIGRHNYCRDNCRHQPVVQVLSHRDRTEITNMAARALFRRESAASRNQLPPAEGFTVAPDLLTFMIAATLAIATTVTTVALGVDGAVIRIAPAGTFVPL